MMVMEKVPVLLAPAASCTLNCTLLNEPTVAGVPVKVTFVPVTMAVRPGGKLAWALTTKGPVPSLTAMVSLYPPCPTVHCPGVSEPNVGAAFMLMAKVPLTTAPAASVTLTLTLLNEPVAVGVLLIVMVLLLNAALRPAGRPLTVRLLNVLVPPAMARLLLKPA